MIGGTIGEIQGASVEVQVQTRAFATIVAALRTKFAEFRHSAKMTDDGSESRRRLRSNCFWNLYQVLKLTPSDRPGRRGMRLGWWTH